MPCHAMVCYSHRLLTCPRASTGRTSSRDTCTHTEEGAPGEGGMCTKHGAREWVALAKQGPVQVVERTLTNTSPPAGPGMSGTSGSHLKLALRALAGTLLCCTDPEPALASYNCNKT